MWFGWAQALNASDCREAWLIALQQLLNEGIADPPKPYGKLRNACRIKGPPQGEDGAQSRHRTSLNGATALKRPRGPLDLTPQRAPLLVSSPAPVYAASLAPFALSALPASAAVLAAAAGSAAGPAGAPSLRRASAEAQSPAVPEGASGFSLGLTLSQQGPTAGAPGGADEPQAWAMRPHAASVRGNSGASDAARYGVWWQVNAGFRGPLSLQAAHARLVQCPACVIDLPQMAPCAAHGFQGLRP